MEGQKNATKMRVGSVVSDRMEKTAVVLVEDKKKHPIYRKYIKRSKRFKIHDEKNECRVGDIVRFVEVRPISKHKCWKLVDIIRKAK
jgi:small subunit ribosomal protein S17